MSHSETWQKQEAKRIEREMAESMLRLRQKVDNVDVLNDQVSLILTELKIVQEELTTQIMLASQLMVLL